MVYGYKVKYNGVLYPAGVDVPIDVKEEVVETQSTTPTENQEGPSEFTLGKRRGRPSKKD